MKKIGLIIANPITNYGAHLQGYATQHVIDMLGVETAILEVLNIKCKKFYIDWGFCIKTYRAMKQKIKGKKDMVITGDAQFKQNIKERTQKAREFRNTRLHDVRVYSNYKELVKDAKSFSTIMVGSDQMWIPGVSFGPLLSLRFVPKGVKRSSYATSLGVSSYPKYCWHSARNMWENMDFISVREEQGAKIIREVCRNEVDVEVVVDPTYLMTKEQWEEVIPVQKMNDKKYVFCYFLGDDEKAKMCAKRYAEKNNLHLVSILSCESFSSIDRTFADENVGAATPEEFINWIRGAECVFTDSFHGLAFSVINHKQFFVFYRVRKDAKQSRNSRIDNILRMWNCESRLIANPDINWDEKEVAPIDYEDVERLITEKRNYSLDYLKKAIGINED